MKRWLPVLLPIVSITAAVSLWDLVVVLSRTDIFPRPHEVILAIGELISRGVLFNYIIASLFRVGVGFTLATLVGVPLGLTLGWFRPALWYFSGQRLSHHRFVFGCRSKYSTGLRARGRELRPTRICTFSPSHFSRLPSTNSHWSSHRDGYRLACCRCRRNDRGKLRARLPDH